MKKIILAAAVAILALAALIAVPASAEKKNGFIIKTDADGDKYVSGYEGSGGDIVIPDGVVWIGKKAFYGNDSITSVTVPKSCWYWVDSNAFALCGSLKTVTFEGDIQGLGNYAFYGCTALERVTFGGDAGREEGDGGIGYYAFGGCTSLKTVTFSDSGAKLDLIGEYAFANCTRLTSINLPADTGTVYSGAFVNCARLEEIAVPENTEFDGDYMLGYMYGRKTKDGALNFFKADGVAAVYPVSLQYLEADSKKITQKAITVTAVKGSAAAKYASANGLACNYVSGSGSRKLPAPKNVKGAVEDGKIVLSWDKVEGASGYRVYIYDAAAGKYKTYKSVKKAKCAVPCEESGEYSFKVAALKENGERYTPGTYSKAVTVTVE